MGDGVLCCGMEEDGLVWYGMGRAEDKGVG